MSAAAAGLQAAQAAVISTRELGGVSATDLAWRFGVSWPVVEAMIIDERLRRGDITMLDLTPAQRRERLDPASIDVHELAAGPIMQPDRLFLPAGRVSLAEVRTRERLSAGSSS